MSAADIDEQKELGSPLGEVLITQCVVRFQHPPTAESEDERLKYMQSVNPPEGPEHKESESQVVYTGDVEYSMNASPLAHANKQETSDKDISASETSSLRTTPEKKSETSDKTSPSKTIPSEGTSVNETPGTIEMIEQTVIESPTVDLEEVKTLTRELLDHERLHSESRESIARELAQLSLEVNEEEIEVKKQNLKNIQSSEMKSSTPTEHMNGQGEINGLENESEIHRESEMNGLENGIHDEEQDLNDTMECDRGEGDGANEQDEIVADKMIKSDDRNQEERYTISVYDASVKEPEEKTETREEELGDTIETLEQLDNKPEVVDSTSEDNETAVQRSDSKEASTPPESERSFPKSEPLSRTCSEDKDRMLSDLESIRSVAGSDSEKSVPSTNVPSVENSPLHKLSSLDSSPLHRASSVESSPQHGSEQESKKDSTENSPEHASEDSKKNSRESSPKHVSAQESKDVTENSPKHILHSDIEATPSSSSPVPVHRTPSTDNSPTKQRTRKSIPTTPERLEEEEGVEIADNKLPTDIDDNYDDVVPSEMDNAAINSDIETVNNNATEMDGPNDTTENMDSINNNPETVNAESESTTNSQSNVETINNINKNPDNINNNQAPRPGNAVRDTTTTSTQV